jgi:uncharacterized CHY-type Zn-finger protein
MSETRAIKVESCKGCVGKWHGCEKEFESCPLPAWPSITKKEKEILLGVIDMGISEYMPIAEYKCPGKILKEKLKSIINSLEVRDEKP